MSKGNARGRMVHRATIQRNTTTNTDAHGQPELPSWSAGTSTACYAWQDKMTEVIDVNKTAIVDRLRAMLPKGTDVTRTDRIGDILDRAGATLFDGPFVIDGDPEYRTTHIELSLRQVD